MTEDEARRVAARLRETLGVNANADTQDHEKWYITALRTGPKATKSQLLSEVVPVFTALMGRAPAAGDIVVPERQWDLRSRPVTQQKAVISELPPRHSARVVRLADFKARAVKREEPPGTNR